MNSRKNRALFRFGLIDSKARPGFVRGSKGKRRLTRFAASSVTDWHVSDAGYFAIASEGNVLR